VAHDARARQRTVFYDAGCGVCTQVMRALARRDRRGRLTWISNQERALIPADVAPELLERTILVVDEATGRRWTRSDGFYEIFAALPFGRLWAWPLLVPGLRTLAGWAYDAFAHHRTRISVRLGLTACEVPRRTGAPAPRAG
jgi:predicted DCC family thiol-disulfide oxidoreductase YuxK